MCTFVKVGGKAEVFQMYDKKEWWETLQLPLLAKQG